MTAAAPGAAREARRGPPAPPRPRAAWARTRPRTRTRAQARTRSPAPHGFTLIELAIVLGVTATLIGLGAPPLSALLARHRTAAAAQTLAADVAFARAQAAERGLDVHFSARTGRDWCYALSVAQPVDCLAPAANVLVLRRVRGAGGTELAGAAPLVFPAGADAGAGTRRDGPWPSGLPPDRVVARFASGHGHVARLRIASALGRASACAEALPLGALPPCRD